MKLYIAGRIAGTSGYLEKFQQGSAEVEAMGHEAVDPCRLHDNCPPHTEWEHWIVCDITAMLGCDGVYALRDWGISKGATIEVQLALRLNKLVIYQSKQTKG